MSLFVPKDRRSLFRQFLAGMYDSVVITDPNGYILEINGRAVEQFGYEPEDVIDKTVSIYIPRLTSDVLYRIRKARENERQVVIDANGVCKDGTKIACEIAFSVIDMMNPGDMVFTIRNVERRREIMNSYRAKSDAFQLAPVALFGCDAAGHIRDVNAAFCEMFGLENADAAHGRVFSDLFPGDPLSENFKKALAGEKKADVVEVECAGGKREKVEVVLAPNLHGRKTIGVVGFVQKACHA